MFKEKSIDTIIDTYRIKNKIPASSVVPTLSVVLLDKNNIIYQKGFGYIDILQQQWATAETTYKWWSITKIITAIAIMQLHEKKKLNIDDQVDAYLPFFKVNKKYKGSYSPIKIKQLLNHSSGLPDNLPQVIGWMHFDNNIYKHQSEFIKKVLPHFNKLSYEPGISGSYTNVGYMLLGEIIARVARESYEQYVTDHILKPMNMHHTHFVLDPEINKNATGTHPLFSLETLFIPFFYHNFLKLCKVKNKILWFKDFFPISTPPSGLIGSPLEMAHLAQMIMNNGTFNGNKILDKNTVNEMIHNHIVTPKYGVDRNKKITYGLGWKIVVNADKFYIYHEGIGIGFSALLRIYPQDSLAIIVMANTMKINRDELIDKIMKLSQ